MSPKKLRRRIAGAGTLAVVATTALLTITAGSASALTAPAYPTVGVYPNWLTTGPSTSSFTVANVTLQGGSTLVTTTGSFLSPNAVQSGDIVTDASGTTNLPVDSTVSAGALGTDVASATSFNLASPASNSVTETVTFTQPDQQSASNYIRSAGSDTTLFMMQQIGDLYTDAGLYGCALLGATNAFAQQNYTCENDEGSAGNNTFSDIPTTDVNDNFDRTEVLEGINNIGSGNGQKQLCTGQPDPQEVDWARSSKPIAVTCTSGNLVELGYAKDSVPAVDFQEINPEAVGSASYYDGTVFAGDGNPNSVPFPSGGIGAVAAGWEPGDTYNCVPSGEHLEGTTCSGTPLNDVDNYEGNTSPAFRLWCEASAGVGNYTNTTEVSGRITDWGQLTDLDAASLASAITSGATISTLPIVVPLDDALSAGSVKLITPTGTSQTLTASAASAGATSITITGSPTASTNFPAGSRVVASAALYKVGDGAPIGVPTRIIGINTGSGTVATFSGYAGSGATGTPTNECASSTYVTDYNGAEGRNPVTPTFGNNQSQDDISVENNASQIGAFANGDFLNDPADQAVEIASALYFESLGVNLSNPNAGTASLTPGTATLPSGVPQSYTGTLLNEDGESPSIPHERSNVYPTSRTLFNMYHTTAIRSSLAGFLNWICDSNDAISKNTDLTSGQNFDNELTNIINDNFEYSRLSDDTPELASQNPGIVGSSTDVGDFVAGGGPNATCDAELEVTGTGTNTVTYTPGGVATNVPSPQAFLTTGPNQAVATAVSGIITAGSGAVTSVSGDTITFASGTMISGTNVNLYFENVAPVLSVTSTNN